MGTDETDYVFTIADLSGYSALTEAHGGNRLLNKNHVCDSSRIDPVCRMQVAIESTASRLNVGGKTYYFCSIDCARTFMEQPARFTE